jgi:DNA repair exonuclease SbcCD nuclease subunit
VALARVVPVVVIAGNHDRRGLLRHLPHRQGGVTAWGSQTRNGRWLAEPKRA